MSAAALAARLEVAIVTGDLDALCRFYTDVLGMRWVLTRPAAPADIDRHAVVTFDDDRAALHIFERAGYDPIAEGAGSALGHRGRLDHINLNVRSRAELDALVARLVAAGASTGEVVDRGPVLLCSFTDPNGTPLQVSCRNDRYDPAGAPVCVVRAHDWFDRIHPDGASATPV